jgi:alginate O-acetyltransferase complex protein AlgJ
VAQTANLTPGGNTRRSVLTGLGTAALAASLPVSRAQAFQFINGTIIGQNNWLFLAWDDPRFSDTTHVTSSIENIGQTVVILKKAGIETVITVTPSKGRIYREFLPTDLTYTERGENRYKFVLSSLTQAGLLAPDLATSMEALHKSDPSNNLYFKADTHWTASGAEFAAQEVAQFVEAKLPLPPSTRPGMTLGPVTTKVRPRNDLADAIGKPGAYPLESFHVHPPVAGRGGLLEDDSADVAVVGSSYMAPEHNFAPMLSNRLKRPVALVWKTYDFGPYQTLLLYLNSRGFKQTRPKLIVWNFHEVGIKAGPEMAAAWTDHAMERPAFIAAVQKAVGAA